MTELDDVSGTESGIETSEVRIHMQHLFILSKKKE